MVKNELHPDFSDFLRLLNSREAEYLLVGGYAVGYHGYPRATGDMDIWIGREPVNAERMAAVLADFGMPADECRPEIFLEKDRIIRMGVPPVRIEVITSASGVDFTACYQRRLSVMFGDIPVSLICLEDLKANKKAAGRHQDLEDLSHLG